MKRELWRVLLGVCVAAGLSLALAACDGNEKRGDSSDGDGDGDADSDGDSDSNSDADECAGYRAEYPAGPYGTSVGSVIADFPGMVDGDNVSHNLFEIFQDTSVVAIAVVIALDT